MLAMLLFFYGLLFGSFFNVAGYRIPKQISIIKPRSSCSNCKQTLSASELIPIFSYLIQGRKCKRCGSAIPAFYTWIELLTACLFALAGLLMGWSFELLVALLLISLLMIIIVSDGLHMIIPNRVLLFFLPLLIVVRILSPLEPWYGSITGGFIGFFLLLFISVISRGGMGGGDVKLFGLLGVVLGLKLVLLAFFLSCLFGVIAGYVGMAKGKIKKNQPIPFGPSIVAGSLTSYFLGESIIEWYFQSIGMG
ncbi:MULTISPECIES: prepilin peptidase [Bacillus]|uniref:Prepilin peptidase n=2 Tax=Bacillus TaxID=1386 RepID=A0A0M5JBQ5_9BACI|nr:MULTISPECIES: A24 family peptidase [Bacillus]ALC81857.1 prepilin peptidase [Bacillus gobiensis]MBP1083168.1 leader peptidase (prepilin peptidase)/N-methyltransferase [Bacillus capparidis]MED1097609.1 prepilin peptidase [Bacillus capparidis]